MAGPRAIPAPPPRPGQARLSDIRIGTSGWNYKHWRERFYPATLPVKSWFDFFQQSFDTVEINNTFYHLPPITTFDNWRTQAPPGFTYAVKANRFLTHLKRLRETGDSLTDFLDRTRHLGAHLGPLLFQLPPRWHPNLERLDHFCAALPGDLTYAIEFRDTGWLTDAVFAILRHYRVALCVHDILPDHPRELTGPIAYLRFHGWGAKYAGRYGDDQLRDWADWIRATAQGGHRVYAYFNNDIDAHAIANARTLREFCAAS